MAATNPDGAGRKWVKARWNIPDRPDNNKIYKNGNKVFIPSRLEDNQILMEKDLTYKTRLENIKDEELKRALEAYQKHYKDYAEASQKGDINRANDILVHEWVPSVNTIEKALQKSLSDLVQEANESSIHNEKMAHIS